MTNSVDYIQSQRWLAYPMMNFFIIIIFFVNYFFALNFIHKKKEARKVESFFIISWLKIFSVLLFLSTSFHCWLTKRCLKLGFMSNFHFLFFLLLQLQFYYYFLYVSCLVCVLMGFEAVCFEEMDFCWVGLGGFGLLSTRLLIKMYNLEASWV